MTGMQHNQPHSMEDMFLNTRRNGIVNLGVRRVTPPNQHIGLLQHLQGQSVFRIAQSGSADEDLRMGEQSSGEHSMNAFRINSPDIGVRLFVNELVPNRYSDRLHKLAERSKLDVFEPAICSMILQANVTCAWV